MRNFSNFLHHSYNNCYNHSLFLSPFCENIHQQTGRKLPGLATEKTTDWTIRGRKTAATKNAQKRKTSTSGKNRNN